MNCSWGEGGPDGANLESSLFLFSKTPPSLILLHAVSFSFDTEAGGMQQL